MLASWLARRKNLSQFTSWQLLRCAFGKSCSYLAVSQLISPSAGAATRHQRVSIPSTECSTSRHCFLNVGENSRFGVVNSVLSFRGCNAPDTASLRSFFSGQVEKPMYVIEQRLNANSNEITGGDGSNVPAYGPLPACTGTVGAAGDMLECLLAHSAPRSTLRSVESRSALTNSTIDATTWTIFEEFFFAFHRQRL